MHLRTLSQADVRDKRVLLRVDFNVPLDEKRNVVDDTRIRAVLPTLSKLLTSGAKVIVMSHFGRPKGKSDSAFTLDPVVDALEKLLKRPVKKMKDCIGKEVEAAISKMKNGEVVLLENTRFHPEEELNDPSFAKKLANVGDLFVNDAFGTIHRAHASTEGVARLLPSYAGLLLEREITTLENLLTNPAHPFVIILGGAKMSTKIGLMKNLLPKADGFLIGGALANTFLFAEGFEIGESVVEKDKRDLAQDILLQADAQKKTVVLPIDAIVADSSGDHVEVADIPIDDMEFNMKMFDIGTRTRQKFITMVHAAKTILWNGPLGLTEYAPFRGGTKAIAEMVASRKDEATTVIGGGDLIGALKTLGFAAHQFTHVSTGGGAMLAFLEGKTLPGLAPLQA